MRKQICLLLLALSLIGCSSAPPPKRYAMEGDVKAVNAAEKRATIAAGDIAGWMEAMTMDYSVKPDSEFAKLHAGDHIKAAVVVSNDSYYVTDVTVVQ